MNTFEFLAPVCIFVVGFQLLRSLYNVLYYFVGPKLGLNVDVTQMGEWAVVTGATDGIGKAYVEYLAEKGINIVLMGRNQLKLNIVASALENSYKVQTKIIAVDFTDGEQIYSIIEKQLLGMEVGILINNVGISYSFPEYFLNVTNKDELFTNIIQCNVTSVTNMCKIILPGMVDRRKGVVINVSSLFAQIPTPLVTVYSASKAYVKKFSTDLAAEYSQFGITIQCILPGPVATKMTKIRSSTWLVPSPQTYVESTLKTIGILENSAGYFPHSLLSVVLQAIHYLSPKAEKRIVLKFMEGVRTKALQKHVKVSLSKD